MNDPKYGYPHPPQGVYQGPPPVMAPPQDYAPPQRQVGFLEGCAVWQLYVAAVSWMSAAVTLQLYSSPNDACDYTAQRVFMCVILGHM
ncbi:hypothetical protein Peur_038779 [Populus x canadensis]